MKKQQIIGKFRKAMEDNEEHENLIYTLIGGKNKTTNVAEENKLMLAKMLQHLYSGEYAVRKNTAQIMALPSSDTMDPVKVKEENSKSLLYRNAIIEAATDVYNYFKRYSPSCKDDIDILEAAKIELCTFGY